MTAQALEQSVLESKDKTQLIQIAEALGVKANSRTKKAEIIGQILATTGASAGGGTPSEAGRSGGNGARATGTESSEPPASAGDAAPVAPSSDSEVAEGAPKAPPADAPAEEPKAEWELALEAGGADDTNDRKPPAGRSDDSKQSDDRGGDKQGESKQSGDRGGDKQGES